MKKCPYCAEEIQDEATICRFCGKELPVAPPNKKSGLLIWLLLLLFFVAIVGGGAYWYYFHGPCGVTKIKQAEDNYSILLNKWDDAVSLAGSTGRIALSGPVGTLQGIKSEVDKLEVPACMSYSKENLLNHMDYVISGFMAFMAEETEASVNSLFTSAGNYLNWYFESIDTVKACAPFCK